jgi:transposase
MPPSQAGSEWTFLLPQALSLFLAQWKSTLRALHPPDAVPLHALLRAALRRSAQLRYLHRLHAVLLVAIGRSCYEVGHWLGDDPRSVERWVRAWEVAGDDGLHDHRQGGRRTRLDFAQRVLLACDLALTPSALGYPQAAWSGKLIARHIVSGFGSASASACACAVRAPASPATGSGWFAIIPRRCGNPNGVHDTGDSRRRNALGTTCQES